MKLALPSLLLATLAPLSLGCGAEAIGPDLADASLGPKPDQPSPPSQPEACDGFDNDGDGFVDEDCGCTTGTTQECFPGTPSQLAQGECEAGVQECFASGEFSVWGPCEGATGPVPENCVADGRDNDCDGVVDECNDAEPPVGDDTGVPAGAVEVPLFLIGDCVTAACPQETPHPVGCNVLFTPGDNRGCVAHAAGSPIVYFQAGDECDAGLVLGTLLCSATPGDPLSIFNCPINKPIPLYPDSPLGCPEIQD